MATKRFVLVLVLLPLLAACEGPVRESRAAPGVATVAFGAAGPASALEAPCVVKPKALVRIKSEISGRVERVAASPGDAVSQGQLLARIDTRDLDNQLERNRLAQRQTQARIALAELQLERARRTRDIMAGLNRRAAPGAKPGELGVEALDVQQKRSDLEQQKLGLEDLRLQERELLRSLSLAEIRSPLAGTVMLREVEEGMLVGSGVSQFGGGDVLFEVADLTRLKAECFARESESWHLAVGLPARVSPDGKRDLTVAVTLSHVAPAVELISGVPRLKFEAEFDPAAGAWRPGVSATIAIASAGQAVSDTLPISAVLEEAGRRYVYVQRGRSYQKTEIRAERAAEAWRVSSGLKRGDLVASNPHALSTEGQENG